MLDRRRFLQALAALGVSHGPLVRAQAPAIPKFETNPFALGIASGYPRPDGMVLWTRLVGDFGPAAIPVRWELSEDEGMRRIVAAGSVDAQPDWAHSVHAEPKGLLPGRHYW